MHTHEYTQIQKVWCGEVAPYRRRATTIERLALYELAAGPTAAGGHRSRRWNGSYLDYFEMIERIVSCHHRWQIHSRHTAAIVVVTSSHLDWLRLPALSTSAYFWRKRQDGVENKDETWLRTGRNASRLSDMFASQLHWPRRGYGIDSKSSAEGKRNMMEIQQVRTLTALWFDQQFSVLDISNAVTS